MMLLSKIDRALSGNARSKAVVPVVETSIESVAGSIGERYEILQGSLDQLTGLAQQLRAVEPLLNDMRQPLTAEFTARREEYLELINLRGAYRETSEQAATLGNESRRLAAALTAAEARGDDLEARVAEHAAAAQDNRLQMDQVRNALSQAEGRVDALGSAERDAVKRIIELEQDQTALRAQLQALESQRGEAEAGRTRAVRDHSLAVDENAALKRRMDEVGLEVARLARAEASLESQLTGERARAAAEQAEASRALRLVEGQAESARSEAAALQARLDTTTARAVRLETLNGELTTKLAEMQAASHATDRATEEMTTGLERALERVRVLEADAEESRQRQAAMDAARLAAVDRAEHLSKATSAQEKALARSEDRLNKLQARLSAVQAEHDARAQQLVEQVASSRSELEALRAESAMTTAALDTARRDREPSGEVAMLNSAVA